MREIKTGMMDVNYFEEMLRAHRQELQERLERIERELDQPADPDTEERAVEREGDEVLESVGLTGLKEIRAIDAALARIKKGTYGVCAACGDEISEERLRVVPYAVNCRNCAA